MFDIGVIATVGFLGAAFATRARLPVVIGYIIAGILIGPNIRRRPQRSSRSRTSP